MKFYLVTNKLLGRRCVVVRFGRITEGVTIRDSVEIDSNNSRYLSSSEHRYWDRDDWQDFDTNTAVFECVAFTLDMYKWLVTSGSNIYDRLRYQVFSNVSRRVEDRLRIVMEANRQRNALRDYPTNYFEYHGNNYSRNTVLNYTRMRKLMAGLGVLVREALKSSDTDALDDYIIRHDHPAVPIMTFKRIRSMLADNDIDLHVVHANCGHYELEDDIERIGRDGDETVCNSCFHGGDIVECDNQGYYDWRDNLYYHERDDVYRDYEEDDEQESDDDPSYLMSYSTNVLNILEPDHKIVSSTHGDFLMGIELEMCAMSVGISNAVEDVRYQLGENYCICKSDGSLPSTGLEIVTAPRGLAEHIKRFDKWEVDSEYRAWNTNKCGMHIHIHSKAFTGLSLGKFIMLINSEENKDFIRQIAGRHPLRDSQAQDYCASESQDILDNPNHAIKGKSSSRYRMVNCENLTRSERDRLGVDCEIDKGFDTIELRIFRASLKKTRLLAQIEFTHAAVMFCRVASWRDLKQQAFLKWLKSTNNQYPHLCDWYGIRRRPNAKNSAPTALTCTDTTTTI